MPSPILSSPPEVLITPRELLKLVDDDASLLRRGIASVLQALLIESASINSGVDADIATLRSISLDLDALSPLIVRMADVVIHSVPVVRLDNQLMEAINVLAGRLVPTIERSYEWNQQFDVRMDQATAVMNKVVALPLDDRCTLAYLSLAATFKQIYKKATDSNSCRLERKKLVLKACGERHALLEGYDANIETEMRACEELRAYVQKQKQQYAMHGHCWRTLTGRPRCWSRPR